jgi:hypothetical protein
LLTSKRCAASAAQLSNVRVTIMTVQRVHSVTTLNRAAIF